MRPGSLLLVVIYRSGGKLALTETNLITRSRKMPEGLWIVLAIIVFVAIYVLAKVINYMRISDKQWQEVDKSKLKEWEDDDEW
jgi:hypothetical protein